MKQVALAKSMGTALLGTVMVWTMVSAQSAKSAMDPTLEEVREGERLVHNMDCNVCHTPKVMTPTGPMPDVSRRLSGHPADEGLPPLPEGALGKDGWGGLFNQHLTAWAGPWGVSFASNLTPDETTGLGTWSEELFAESMRTGTHVGETRPYLPPMPTYSRLTDSELHAIFAYLRSIEPVSNQVPVPLPPPSAPLGTNADR